MIKVLGGNCLGEKFYLFAIHGLHDKLLVIAEEEETSGGTTCLAGFEHIRLIVLRV